MRLQEARYRAVALVALGCVLLGWRWRSPGAASVQVQPDHPQAGSTTLASRGQVDSPLTDMGNHLACLREAHLPVHVVSPTRLQVGPRAGGPDDRVRATPGGGAGRQIDGRAQGAEVIGTALVYPNQGSDAELPAIGPACRRASRVSWAL